MYRKRRLVVVFVSLAIFACTIVINLPKQASTSSKNESVKTATNAELAIESLSKLIIKNRSSGGDYSRDNFGKDWTSIGGCDTRNIILNRDLQNVSTNDKCEVVSGTLDDPYTGKVITFVRGADSSGNVQIDHVVALSNAWQTGANQFTNDKRLKFANDPLELLAVDGKANMDKSDGDAATWLPPNKAFRCQYVTRQIAVKQKYGLWITRLEHDAIVFILNKCPNQKLPTP